MITTQKQIQELVDRENKMSPFERITRYLKTLFLQIFLAALFTIIVVWVLVAFTDFKLPFLYSENKVEYNRIEHLGGVTRTTKKKVIINLNPTIRKDAIVINPEVRK